MESEGLKIQVLEQTPLPAEVQQFTLPIGEGKYHAFRATLPEGYTYPPPQRHQEWASKRRTTIELPEPGLVARDIVKTPNALLDEARKMKTVSFSLCKHGSNDWYLHSAYRPIEVPQSMRDIIATALAHELSTNPHIESAATVDVRFETTEEFRGHPVTHPHVDNFGRKTNIYFFSLPPTTQAYVGKLKSSMRDGSPRDNISSKHGGKWWDQKKVKKHIRWLSLLPNTLYLLTGDSAHSMPDLVDLPQEKIPDERFLMRITF